MVSEVTVQSLLNELEAAREKASDLDQLSAAVRAIEAKAKVSGIMIQRLEVGTPGSFAELDSVEDIVSAMIEGYGKEGYQFTAGQREEFTEILSGWAQAANSFLASCRPMKAVEGISPADIRDRERRAKMRKREPRSIAGPR